MGRSLPNADFALTPFGDDPWRLIADGDALALPHLPALFAIGDGFLGMRGPAVAPEPARVYLNGVFEKMPIAYHEAAHGFARESDVRLAVADATTPRVTVDGIALGAPHRVELDMARGMLVQHFELAGCAVELAQFAAMAHPGVVMTRVRVAPGTRNAAVAVVPTVSSPPGAAGAQADGSVHDPRVGPAFHETPWRAVTELPDGRGRIDSLDRSGFAVAALAAGGGSEDASDEAITFDCVAAYATERGEGAEKRALAQAETLVALAEERGFDALAAEQEQWFSTFWEDAFLSFPEARTAEQAMRHGMFQLIQAVGRGGKTSIGAKGQTGEGYEGHIFWDADAYVLPALLGVRPELARDLLLWRIDRLEPAFANARAMGQRRGALFPWRTIDGGECSAYFPAGSAQYHINADVAHALACYVELTDDRSLLDRGGARMLVETARIWLEVGFHDPQRDGAFVINRVTGPDEYSALVDNNLYTNFLAAEHLRFAAEVGAKSGLIDAEERGRMAEAADAMLLTFDEGRGVYAQDDSFFALEPWPIESTPADRFPLLLHFHPLEIYRHRVAKQADAVLLLSLFPDRFDAAMRKAMFDAYEAVTVHDSTLSASAFATAAAQLGDTERAAAYWRISVLTDLLDLFGNSHHGLHMAALAGAWTSLTAGFAGMRTINGKLAFSPAAIPGVGAYRFRIWYRGRHIEVGCSSVGEASYRMLSGQPLTILSHGSPVELASADERLTA